MIQLTIQADVNAALRTLESVRADQVPFATCLALNTVGKAARDSVRGGLKDRYRDRSGSLAFLRQGVRLQAATKSHLAATVYDADWFMRYQEAGGDKASRGAEPPSWMGIRGASIAGVRFLPSVAALVGQHGSGYFVQRFPATGTWFLGHRTQSRVPFSVVMLLEQRVRVKPTFGMVETVQNTVERGFNEAFSEAMKRAMATAR
jgi:hypothetical protein